MAASGERRAQEPERSVARLTGQRSGVARTPPAAHPLLALQRQIGNRAVNELLRGGSVEPSTEPARSEPGTSPQGLVSNASAPLTVQRYVVDDNQPAEEAASYVTAAYRRWSDRRLVKVPTQKSRLYKQLVEEASAIRGRGHALRQQASSTKLGPPGEARNARADSIRRSIAEVEGVANQASGMARRVNELFGPRSRSGASEAVRLIDTVSYAPDRGALGEARSSDDDPERSFADAMKDTEAAKQQRNRQRGFDDLTLPDEGDRSGFALVEQDEGEETEDQQQREEKERSQRNQVKEYAKRRQPKGL